MAEDIDYSPRILVFFSRSCPSCIRKLGLKPDGITHKKHTNLTKALELMSRNGFEVIRKDITEESNKAHLLSITARPDIFLPVIITPFASLENPPLQTVTDIVNAILGLTALIPELHR